MSYKYFSDLHGFITCFFFCAIQLIVYFKHHRLTHSFGQHGHDQFLCITSTLSYFHTHFVNCFPICNKCLSPDDFLYSSKCSFHLFADDMTRGFDPLHMSYTHQGVASRKMMRLHFILKRLIFDFRERKNCQIKNIEGDP